MVVVVVEEGISPSVDIGGGNGAVIKWVDGEDVRRSGVL